MDSSYIFKKVGPTRISIFIQYMNQQFFSTKYWSTNQKRKKRVLLVLNMFWRIPMLCWLYIKSLTLRYSCIPHGLIDCHA